jgi:hypothetical protein
MASIGSTNSSPKTIGENLVNPAIVNLELTTANTEYTYALPTNCRRFWFQNRNDGKIFLRHVSASAEYVTIFPGQVYSADLLGEGVSIYLESPKASQTIELEYWLKT